MNLDRLRSLVVAECVRLAKLGSADAIARELASRGMHGTVDSQHCPLANGISDTLMISPGRLHVRRDEICAVNPNAENDGAPLVVWLVSLQEGFAVLRDFVGRFDNGEFPFLHPEAQ